MAGWTRMGGGSLAMVAVVGIAALAWSSPARAWTGIVSWPTYDRTGPDKHYRVLNELDRGTTLDVLACENGWCRIQTDRSVGYIEQSAISEPGAMISLPATQAESDGCFTSHETGYGKGENWRYCPR